jgi:uroporphyrinogen III methyltransferase/synthase
MIATETVMNPDLRIGICGSASVGKTTLAHALARDFGLPCLREEMRDYLEASGSDLTLLPPANVESILLHLWRQRQDKERTANSFIADNCPIDFAAYALYYGCLSDLSRDALLNEALRNLDRYHAIFLLPWGVLPYEQDGIRPANPHLQLRYHYILEGLLRRHFPADKLHSLPTTLVHLEDRRRWVAERLAASSHATKPRRGIVYLVGAGPGDPNLLTLRAAQLLQQADVVAYDLLISPELLARIPAHVELLPVGRRNGMGTVEYRLHPEALARAREGKIVVRLKCGDPLLYGRGGEEAEELRAAGIPFEIVPGITAALGAAAYAGIPLTQRGVASEVLLSAGHEDRPAASTNGFASPHQQKTRTTVLYMVAHRLQANLARLQAEGYSPDTPAALIFAATTPAQHLVEGTLATLGRDLSLPSHDAPALLIVGEVVSLRKNIHWFQAGPLRQRRILVARAREGHSRIAASLRALGAEVLESPRVSVLPLADPAPLESVLAQTNHFDAIVFSCAPGARALAQSLAGHGDTDHRGLHSFPQIICIGEQAREAMHSLGMSPHATLPGSCAEALAQQSALFCEKRLLLITSNEGRPKLARELASLGAEVQSVAAYQVSYQYEDLATRGPFDLVVLPSSSAARLLLTHSSAAGIQHLPAIAIGPHTRAVAEECGATSVTVAPHDDIDAILSAVLQTLADNTSTPRNLKIDLAWSS